MEYSCFASAIGSRRSTAASGNWRRPVASLRCTATNLHPPKSRCWPCWTQPTTTPKPADGRPPFGPFATAAPWHRVAQTFQTFLQNPIRYWSSFAIPNEAVLAAIGDLGKPVVEMGAGTGYWSANLQARGVDVVAYDAFSPATGANNNNNNNLYFHHTFTTVLQGTCDTVFGTPPTQTDAALLLVWPNNPDNYDRTTFAGDPGIPSEPWDAECLEHYLAASGTTVIYVGERAENVHVLPGAPPESGLSATRRFQTLLRDKFEMVQQIDIPQWWTVDDATIWKKRKI